MRRAGCWQRQRVSMTAPLSRKPESTTSARVPSGRSDLHVRAVIAPLVLAARAVGVCDPEPAVAARHIAHASMPDPTRVRIVPGAACARSSRKRCSPAPGAPGAIAAHHSAASEQVTHASVLPESSSIRRTSSFAATARMARIVHEARIRPRDRRRPRAVRPSQRDRALDAHARVDGELDSHRGIAVHRSSSITMSRQHGERARARALAAARTRARSRTPSRASSRSS